MASLQFKKIFGDLREKFISSKYIDDPVLLKQRSKEQAQECFWIQMFESLFVHATAETRDDLLFYVKYDSKNKKEITDVFRRDSKSLPDSLDSTVLWDQTLYLNILLHEFEYHLACCVLTPRDDSKSIVERIKTQITMQIYPSTIERRMDKKGKKSDSSYPSLMFYVDNFEEVFNQISLSNPGEKVVVQIVALNHAIPIRRLIFIGGLDFSTLKQACIDKQKAKENPSFIQRLSQNKTKIYTEFQDLHFIQIKGPNSKGHAEMALHVSEPVSDDNEVITLNSLEDLIEDNSNENGHIPGPGIGTSSEAPNHSSNSQSLKHLENEQTEFISTTGNTGKDSVEINLSENQIVVTETYESYSVSMTTQSKQDMNSSESSPVYVPCDDKEESISQGSDLVCSSEHFTSNEGSKVTDTSQTKDDDTEDGRWNKKLKKSKLLSDEKRKDEEDYIVHAYFTSVRLPWYIIAEDIFHGTRMPLF